MLCCSAKSISACSCAQGGELKASIAFPALALFDLFRNPIRLIPDSINMLISANIAMNRLQAYLDVRCFYSADGLRPTLVGTFICQFQHRQITSWCPLLDRPPDTESSSDLCLDFAAEQSAVQLRSSRMNDEQLMAHSEPDGS